MEDKRKSNSVISMKRVKSNNNNDRRETAGTCPE